MKRRIIVQAALPCLSSLALSLHAVPLTAQACVGYPQRSVGALVAGFRFPEDAMGYALGGMVSSQDGGVFFEGSFGIAAPDAEELENTKIVGGAAAYEVESLAREASVCPTVGVEFSWVGDLNTWSVPFGVAIGKTIPVGRRGGAGITPFAVPQFIYVRSSLDDVDDSAESDVFVGLTGGLTVHVGSFVVAGGIGKIFEEERDAVFSVTVGVAWR